MPTLISNFRFSFIWVETIPSIFAQQLAPTTPYTFLSYPGQYARVFDGVRAGRSMATQSKLPWPRPQGHHFWKQYFGGRHAGAIIGAEAWRKHVPLRDRFPIKLIPDGSTPQLRVIFEVFYSPQGIGLIATAYYRSEAKSLFDVATLAHAVRYRRQFHTDADHMAGGLSLQSAAEHALAVVRRQAFGDVEAFAGYNQPFTVTSFVQGEIDDPAVAVQEGSDEHRVLEALTGWNQNFARMNLTNTPIQSAKLTIHSELDSDLVYARKAGRAIWLPREFAEDVQRPKLSCYHRNITLASLQTMSLGEFVDWVARRLDRGETIQPLLVERAKRAARVLDVLASGDRTLTYRSMSIDAQITAANWRKSIDTIANSA